MSKKPGRREQTRLKLLKKAKNSKTIIAPNGVEVLKNNLITAVIFNQDKPTYKEY